MERDTHQEPLNETEAMKQPIWSNAMEEEIRSIEKNGTWRLIDLPTGKQCIEVKWIFKKKLNPDGSILKHKARLVAKGFFKSKGWISTKYFL